MTPPVHAQILRRPRIAWLGLAILPIVLSACGSHSSKGIVSQIKPKGAASGAVTPGPGVSASDVAVIGGWADALRMGHPQRAASYWAHPSAMVNGINAAGRLAIIRIRTTRDALSADETLPCGAILRGTSRIGPYVAADFTLSARTGVAASAVGCSGPARVDFLIRDAHIVRWLRAPVASGPRPSVARSVRRKVNPETHTSADLSV